MRNTCRDGLIAANAEAIAMYIQSLLAFAAQTRSTVKAMFSNRDGRRRLVRQEAVVARISPDKRHFDHLNACVPLWANAALHLGEKFVQRKPLKS